MPSPRLREKHGLAHREILRTMEGVLKRLVLLLISLIACLQAHQIDEISMKLETPPERWKATLEVDAAYMLPRYRGDAEIAPFDMAWLQSRSPEEWEEIRYETRSYIKGCIRFGTSDLDIRFPDFDSDPPRFMDEPIVEMPPMMQVEITGSYPEDGLSISWQEPFGVVLIIAHGEDAIPLVSGESYPATGPNESVSASPGHSFLRWVHLGFVHIVPRGFDHVLFILAIFLLMPKWKPLLTQSLIFTLAHSLTLAAAALGWVHVPGKIIEPLIALSIAWVAVENFMLKEPSKRRYIIIGLFGLLHGLGFASILAEALPDSVNPLMPLIGFNVGVELGQILVLGVAFVVLGLYKEEIFKHIRKYGSCIIALIGLFWFVERLIA